jgi:hypothetical protein
VLIFCVLYVSLQLVLAIRGFSNPGRVRFAWGMYAVVTELPTIDIVYPDSVQTGVAARFVALEGRPEMDYESLLPPYICSVVPAARAVHVESRSYPCRR